MRSRRLALEAVAAFGVTTEASRWGPRVKALQKLLVEARKAQPAVRDLEAKVDELDVLEVDKAARTLVDRFDLKLVALTRGQLGTALYTPKKKLEGRPVSYQRAENADAVGAGDACSAGLMVGLVRRWRTTASSPS